MTITLLYKAFEKASRLSENEQKLLASQILEDIKGEMKWDSTLEKTSDKLVKLSQKAIKEHKAGKTRKLDVDNLSQRDK